MEHYIIPFGFKAEMEMVHSFGTTIHNHCVIVVQVVITF